MDKNTDDVVKRFWAQVDRTGGRDACWNWTGTVRPDGYGVFNVGVRQVLAHRLVLDLSGVDIPHGYVVLHTCSNKLCCNPAHLRIVTRAEQMAARSRLRRLPRPDERRESDKG